MAQQHQAGKISIHAPTRGATLYGFGYALSYYYFNPRSHERSDKRKGFYIYMDNSISIHAPTRGATLLMMIYLLMMIFQSTLPREERRATSNVQEVLNEFQSTLPREERQGKLQFLYMELFISIHAPTRGATCVHLLFVFLIYISIHAPTRGATIIVRFKMRKVKFQSTLPREERHL